MLYDRLYSTRARQGFERMTRLCCCQQGSDLHYKINDNYMDNTADAESEALWAEFDALEAALV